MTGDALRWFATLPPELRNDWEALQAALFAQYPSATVKASSGSTFPRVGTVKVVAPQYIFTLSTQLNQLTGGISAIRGVQNLLRVRFFQTADETPQSLYLVNASTRYDCLGATLMYRDPSVKPGCGSDAAISAVREGEDPQGLHTSHWTTTSGPCLSAIWRITEDGHMIATDGNVKWTPCMNSMSGNVYLVRDFERFKTMHPSNSYVEVALLFVDTI